MGKDKLYLAAQAAGFAMVNPDDGEFTPRQSSKPGPAEIFPKPWTATPAKVQPATKPGFALDWLGFLISRPAS